MLGMLLAPLSRDGDKAQTILGSPATETACG
jgi:hypothetical protein